MSDELFDGFNWHSSLGLDDCMEFRREYADSLPNTKEARRSFKAAGDNERFLVHKTTRALWKVSDDNSKIEPVFSTDVLTDEQAAEIMSQEPNSR